MNVASPVVRLLFASSYYLTLPLFPVRFFGCSFANTYLNANTNTNTTTSTITIAITITTTITTTTSGPP
jgi:hypothetical protein